MDATLDNQTSILQVKPSAPLTQQDFVQLSTLLDTYLAQHGTLKGLLIETEKFPGWKDIDGFKAHVKFIKGHQAKIRKIALETNSNMAVMANIMGLFVKPEIKHFTYGQAEAAKQWLMM